MDFISIAQTVKSLGSLKRYLEEDEVDDFVNLDTSHTSHHDYPHTATGTSDSILDMTKEAAALYDPADSLGDSPMISASAEAELFLLATNFLLCESFRLFIERRICVFYMCHYFIIALFVLHIFMSNMELCLLLIIVRCCNGADHHHDLQDIFSGST